MTKTIASAKGTQPRARRPAASQDTPVVAGGGTGSGARRRLSSPLVAAVLIVVAGLGAYANSFRGVLVFDDIGSIASNPHITSLWPLSRAMWAPRDVTVAGRPVASLTLAINYALAPADARDAFKPAGPDTSPEDAARFYRNIWGYHALNLAVHLLAALALFGVVRRTAALVRRNGDGGRAPLRPTPHGATALAFAVAVIWVVHPLHTQAVTYVVQRVESLMGLFYLLTLYCAIRAAGAAPRRRWWMAASIASCAAGMGSKEVMVTAPLAVLLWDWTFLVENAPAGSERRSASWRAVLADRWHLYAGLAATWAILLALAATNPRPHSAGFGLGGWTWWTSLQTQAGVVAYYLRLAFVPHPLVFDYEWPRAASFMDTAPQALLLAALVGLSVYGVVRRHVAGLLGAWFFLVMAPTSSILPIPTEVAAEHRMYLPVAAIIALGAVAFFRWTRRPAAWGLVTAVAIAAVFGGVTYARNQDYHSDERLMRDTVEKRPFNIRARVAYGADLLGARRFGEAEAELTVAARLEGSDKAHAQASMYLGSALCAQGRIAEGIAHLQQALSLDAGLGEAHALLGEAYAGQGRLVDAVAHFRQALIALPDNTAVLRRVAWLLATSSDPRVRNGGLALELAERAVRLTDRRDVLALEGLMAAYAEQDRFADAAAAGREALALARAQGNIQFVAGLRDEIARCEGGQKLREP